MKTKQDPVFVDYVTYEQSVGNVLALLNADTVLSKQSKVLIKPNLVNDSFHPVTTPAPCCEAIIKYVKACSKADIIIAEGSGDASLETHDIFQRLGYHDLSFRYGVELVDLNHEPLVKKRDRRCPFFPEIYLPKIAFESFIVSVPVLKAHSLSTLSGTLKNMVGFAPPKYYSGQYGIWKKAVFHKDVHQAILDLNQYRTPDLSIMDASIGLSEYHLGGPECVPPVNKIIAGFSPVEVDRLAAGLLGLDWKSIRHLNG
jgi:uncharacterized protein (DUF362 family)